jgi:uncharacterized protein (TIGR03067 family)
MKRLHRLLLAVSLVAAACSNGLLQAAEPEAGFKSIFNGKDLTGWEGNPDLWSTKDGTITGETKAEPKLTHNTFLVYTNGTVADFELRLSYRIVNGNSGIQYRSRVIEKGKFGPIVAGYQADFEAGKTYSGILYEERGRGILAQRGQKTVIKPDPADPMKHKVEVVGSLGKSEDIQAKIKNEDWNDYVVIANGNHFQHFINGVPTVDVVDEHEAKASKSGILALQIHVGPPMTVQFRNIRIKKLSGTATARSDLDQMQGEWVPAEFVSNGKASSTEALAAIKVTMKDNEYLVARANGSHQGTFKLNENTTPKSMDLTPQSGSDVPAIYEIAGDTFKACYALNGASRPAEFKSAEGSDHVLVVYKRKAQ